MNPKIETWLWALLRHVVLAMGAIVVCLPLIWMVSASFKPLGNIFKVPIEWIPSNPTLNNYVDAWNTAPFLRYFLNSLYVSGLTTLLNLFLCSLAAFGFAKFNFPFKNLLFLFILATLMIPFNVVIIPLFIMMRQLGWLDSYTALIVPNMVSAFGIFFLRQFILTIPDDLLEAARMDGASEFRLYWNVILPLSSAPLVALAVFIFLDSWNSLLWPLVVMQTDELSPIALGLTSFQNTHGTDYHLVAAASTLLVIPMLLVFLLLQRYFVEGITLSGLKG
jgi:multiple sugar transport system permease protein